MQQLTTPWGLRARDESGPVSPVFIIGEIGINHNGDLSIAKQLIDMAKSCGCDAVKFQKRTVDLVYSREYLDSPRESPWGTTQRAQKEALELGPEDYDEIDAYCRSVGIPWFASAWDVPSQIFIRRHALKYNKVASPMLTHEPLLEAVAEERKPTFVSTGMSTLRDVDRAVEIFRHHECPFVLMHCVSDYPCPEKLVNLRCMAELRGRYGCPVGYSGHEASLMPAVFAALMGAVAVERHITLNRSMYGTDQSASLERRGLQLLVEYIRMIPTVLGDGIKRMTPGEVANARKLRYWMASMSALALQEEKRISA